MSELSRGYDVNERNQAEYDLTGVIENSVEVVGQLYITVRMSDTDRDHYGSLDLHIHSTAGVRKFRIVAQSSRFSVVESLDGAICHRPCDCAVAECLH
jgi:hypothetical protein